ncbi:hypothetical protein WK72_21580 [Burkholderia ubonensis]|uniref:hypothetical protein n=1 Tax=Burkholderia ubonensis TaxID=101571 RepID=UPI00075CF865|nr:hypothetical protein [Burkholderia ubonensis]KVG35091.1 hypothetical protein WJ31_22090 [Burkholderia ubonensis]KVU63684.1 hypothetical protein WK72_21580 [Burkholderia ubonensis]
MKPEKYKEILAEFDTLLGHAHSVCNRLTGRPIEGLHLAYVDTIYTKLICHGISLRRLSPTLDVRVSQQELWDLPSVCAVSRSLIEAYDALAYIGAPDISEKEREFRFLVWNAHDQVRRLTMLERIGSVGARRDEILTKAAEVTRKIRAHECFANAPKDLQARVKRGEPFHLTRQERNLAHGINDDFYVAATMFLSQYLHTFPFAIHQLMHAKAGDPASIQLSSMPLRYTMPFIIKAVDAMTALWPDAQGAVSDDLDMLIRQWRQVAEQGVANFDE